MFDFEDHLIRSLFVAALFVLFGIAFIAGFCGSCAVVKPGTRGVRVTLGSVTPYALPEGFTLKMPFISDVVPVSIQQKTFRGTAAAFSSDLQNVMIEYAIMYRIPEAKVVEIYRGYQGEPLETLVVPRINEYIKQVTALHRAEEIVKAREQIRVSALDKTRAAVGEIVLIVDLSIVNLDFSDAMEHSIEQKVVQEQLALAKNFELQKEQKEAEITIVKATAEAESVKIRGQALKESPQVVELEIVKKWNGISPSTLVVGSGGANIILPVRKDSQEK
jgi:prohibitin 2